MLEMFEKGVKPGNLEKKANYQQQTQPTYGNKKELNLGHNGRTGKCSHQTPTLSPKVGMQHIQIEIFIPLLA